MTDIIVRSAENITLLGGGKARLDELAEALSHAPRLVAVDGGAGFALRHGRMPEAVLGDMDSLAPALRDSLPPAALHPITDQDSTDFDKALRSVEAPLVLGVGFLGRRMDHQLANLNVLVRRVGQKCLLIGKRDVVFAIRTRIALGLAPGSRVSLFPMAPVTGRSDGLHWPIDGIGFAPAGVVGTSNRVSDGHAGPVTLEFDRPGMLAILPRAALNAAIAGLLASA